MPDSKASREMLALGWAMTSEGLGLGLEFLLPTLLGLLLDQRWNSTPWATLIGTVLGFTVGMLHIARIARKAARRERTSSPTETPDEPSAGSDRSARPDDS